MQLGWILSPVAQYAFLALALVGVLTVFVSLKQEISTLRRRAREKGDAEKAAVVKLAAELACLRGELEQVRATSEPVGDLTLTRRAQALRMSNRGESAATIAAALRAPRNEIDLLLKLQNVVSAAAPSARETANSSPVRIA